MSKEILSVHLPVDVNTMRKLSTLKIGEEAIILTIENEKIAPKLISMGVFPHARVRVIRRSYFDQLLYLSIGSLNIALSPHEAAVIIIN